MAKDFEWIDVDSDAFLKEQQELAHHIDKEWRRLLKTEAKLREEVYQSHKKGKVGEDSHVALTRAWFVSVADLLSAHGEALDRGEMLKTLPRVLLEWLAHCTESFAKGVLPAPIKDVLKKNGRPSEVLKHRDIGWAVAYQLCCRREGYSYRGRTIRFVDLAHTKNVSEWFGVTKRRVQAWVLEYPPAKLGEATVDKRFVVERTRLAGERYRKALSNLVKGRGRN